VVACGRRCGGTDLEDEDGERGAEPVSATVGARSRTGGRATHMGVTPSSRTDCMTQMERLGPLSLLCWPV
jgi:hypothetical protein